MNTAILFGEVITSLTILIIGYYFKTGAIKYLEMIMDSTESKTFGGKLVGYCYCKQYINRTYAIMALYSIMIISKDILEYLI